MRSFLICTFLFVCIESIGQDNFGSGFIVKNSNDTIRGLLRSDEEEKLSGQVIFKIANGTQQLYTPSDIHSFGFDGGSTFRVIEYIDPTDKFTPKKHFAKLLFDGINDLYSFIKKETFFFVAKTKEDTTYLMYDDFTSALGDVQEQGNFRNQLFFIARDCDKIRSKSDKIFYSEKALLDFFISLDKCQGNNKASAVYFKKAKSETQINFFAGGITFGDEYEISVQGTVKFLLPSQSRKTSLNVGIAYLYAKHIKTFRDAYGDEHPYDHMAQLIELPVTIQYDILDKKIRPFAYGGFALVYIQEEKYKSIYNSTETDDRFGFTLVGGIGIDYHISNRASLKADLRYDLFFHYPVIGLGFRVK